MAISCCTLNASTSLGSAFLLLSVTLYRFFSNGSSLSLVQSIALRLPPGCLRAIDWTRERLEPFESY